MSFWADIAANVIAVAHLAYFGFIVGGMVAVVLAVRQDVSWVRNPWFRIAHVAAIYVVLVEEATGLPCPLNVLQWGAREAAIGSTQASTGVGGLLDYLLYHTVSPLALDVMYWSFGVLVVALLWAVPPRWSIFRNRRDESQRERAV